MLSQVSKGIVKIAQISPQICHLAHLHERFGVLSSHKMELGRATGGLCMAWDAEWTPGSSGPATCMPSRRSRSVSADASAMCICMWDDLEQHALQFALYPQH